MKLNCEFNYVRALSICEEYARGVSGVALARQYDVCPARIYAILERMRYTRRKPEQTSRKHPLNRQFFEDWSPRMAYWLGMLCADGCLSRNMIQLALKSSDKQHLIKFRDAIGSDYDPYVVKRGKTSYSPDSWCWRLGFECEYMAETLRKIGFVDFKRGDPALLRRIPVPLFSHWLRGMTDGDGTICFVKQKYPCWRLVDRHQTILQDIARLIENHLSLSKLNTYKSKTIWVITAKKRKGEKILHFLYKNNCESLDRKRLVYETISAMY